MKPPSNKPDQRTVVFGFIAIFIVAIIVVAVVVRQSNSTNNTDAASATTNGVINESELVEKSGPNYSALIEKGFSEQQIDTLQYTLYQYAQPSGISVRDITVPKEGVIHTLSDPDNGIFYHTYDFTVKFDDKNTFKARAEVSGLSGVRLYLYNPTTNALVYDSKDQSSSTIN